MGSPLHKAGDHADKDGDHADKDGDHADKDGDHADDNLPDGQRGTLLSVLGL